MRNKREKTTVVVQYILYPLAALLVVISAACTAVIKNEPATHTYTVHFSVEGKNGIIQAAVNGKTISADSRIESGTVITFTAVPDADYETNKWTINSGQAVNDSGIKGKTTISITIIADTSVTVSFKQKPKPLDKQQSKPPSLQKQETTPPAQQNKQDAPIIIPPKDELQKQPLPMPEPRQPGNSEHPPVQPPADGTPEQPSIPELEPNQPDPPAEPPFTGTEEERKKLLFERLLNAALRLEKNADVSELNISSVKQIGGGEYIQLYNEFLKKYPFVFHITEDGSISYNYKPENENELAKYIFDYRIYSDFENYYTTFEAALEDFYGRLREGMTDAEIAYVLHSALAEKTYYGFGIHASDTLGTIMKGRAICQGYSLIYRRLLLGLGINAECVFGPLRNDPSGHMWNSIQLNNQWYNVDVTWDDNKNAEDHARSFSLGKYFLTSDIAFYAVKRHPQPEADALAKTCNDTTYDSDSGIFRDGDKKTEPVYHKGYWYWLSHTDKSLYRSRFDGSEKTMLYRLKNRKIRNYLYNRLELGETALYFIDNITDSDKITSIYSIGYDGTNVQQLEQIGFWELAQDNPVSLVPVSDKLSIQRGKNALRGELMLSKMKDAYYHGTEDYFKPENTERKDLVAAISRAEALLEQDVASEQTAQELYEALRHLRKNYRMERTRTS